MAIIEKARKWMEKFTGLEPKYSKKDQRKTPSADSTRKKQGPGAWQADIGEEEKPKLVDGKGDHSIARPL